MGDVAEKRVGDRTYRVHGLQAKAEAIRGGARRVSETAGSHLDVARAALVDWHGAHSTTFVERVDTVMSAIVTFRLALETSASRCANFPADAVSQPSIVTQYEYSGSRLHHTDDQPSTSSAVPANLRGYATAAGEQAGTFAGAAAPVTTDGLTAEVSQLRGLTADERTEQREAGTPPFEIEDMRVWGEFSTCPVTEVFDLPDLSDEAARLRSDVDDAGAWVTAVAYAFELGDQGLLDLLLEYPEIGRFIADGVADGQGMSGEAALALILANIDRVDNAAEGGTLDGNVSLSDLQATADDLTMPPYLRAAARYLIENRLLLSMVSIVDQPVPYEIEPDDVALNAGRISMFLEFNHSLNRMALDFDEFDAAGQDPGDADGYVSEDDLRHVADDASLPQSTRDAAAFLLANPMLTQRLMLYEQANVSRMTYDHMRTSNVQMDDENVWGFTRNGVLAMAVDQQAFPDPEDAERFVLSLPVADRHGNGGIDITLLSDEGVKALANSALIGADGDLSDQHAVISHLPETTSWGERGAVTQNGGVRNQLITGFYDVLATRADGLFAGDLAGMPNVPGHPGANWLMFAPWASNGVGGAITGETGGPLGITTSGVMQAAADGNQFIFDDIGGRFANFIELYEANPNPSEAQLEGFFAGNFSDGDGTIRDGFAAYAAALEEPDPVRQQRLMFEGNTLVATHEQAGVQPYLDDIAVGPDSIATRYVQLRIGDRTVAVTDDVPAGPTVNNLIIPSRLGSFDPGDASAYRAGDVSFSVGGDTDGVVDVSDIGGHEQFRPGFSGSTDDWMQDGGSAGDPEGLRGSNATSWPDWNERMNYILHLFEQNHTNPQVWDTDTIGAGLENVDWLVPEARAGG